MNFDKVIMNPPYMRTLHIQITRKAMEHCDSAVILQPAEWVMNKEWETMQRCVLRRFVDIAQKITSLERLNRRNLEVRSEEQCKDESSYLELAIFTYSRDAENNYWKTFWQLRYSDYEIRILDYVKSKTKKSFIDVIDKDEKTDGIRVPIRPMVGNTGWVWRGPSKPLVYFKYFKYAIDNKVNGVNYRRYLSSMSSSSRSAMKQFNIDPDSPMKFSVKFNTTYEAANFYDSLNTNFVKYVIYLNTHGQNVYWHRIPFMEDYSMPWTDERFYDHFGICSNDRKIIEETIKKNEW